MRSFLLGQPGKEASVDALENSVGKIENVELLGHRGKLTWTQTETGMKVELAEEQPSKYAVTLKSHFCGAANRGCSRLSGGFLSFAAR